MIHGVQGYVVRVNDSDRIDNNTGLPLPTRSADIAADLLLSDSFHMQALAQAALGAQDEPLLVALLAFSDPRSFGRFELDYPVTVTGNNVS